MPPQVWVPNRLFGVFGFESLTTTLLFVGGNFPILRRLKQLSTLCFRWVIFVWVYCECPSLWRQGLLYQWILDSPFITLLLSCHVSISARPTDYSWMDITFTPLPTHCDVNGYNISGNSIYHVAPFMPWFYFSMAYRLQLDEHYFVSTPHTLWHQWRHLIEIVPLRK